MGVGALVNFVAISPIRDLTVLYETSTECGLTNNSSSTYCTAKIQLRARGAVMSVSLLRGQPKPFSLP